MRLAVNVGFLFAELPYLERFLAVRAAGFDAVEFAWPTEPIEDVARAVNGGRAGRRADRRPCRRRTAARRRGRCE